jgi:hypothetical protein
MAGADAAKLTSAPGADVLNLIGKQRIAIKVTPQIRVDANAGRRFGNGKLLQGGTALIQ